MVIGSNVSSILVLKESTVSVRDTIFDSAVDNLEDILYIVVVVLVTLVERSDTSLCVDSNPLFNSSISDSFVSTLSSNSLIDVVIGSNVSSILVLKELTVSVRDSILDSAVVKLEDILYIVVVVSVTLVERSDTSV